LGCPADRNQPFASLLCKTLPRAEAKSAQKEKPILTGNAYFITVLASGQPVFCKKSTFFCGKIIGIVAIAPNWWYDEAADKAVCL